MALESSGTMSIGGNTSGRSINLELGRPASNNSNLRVQGTISFSLAVVVVFARVFFVFLCIFFVFLPSLACLIVELIRIQRWERIRATSNHATLISRHFFASD